MQTMNRRSFMKTMLLMTTAAMPFLSFCTAPTERKLKIIIFADNLSSFG